MVRKKRKAKPGNPGLAIGYMRASTEDQRLGPKDQALKLQRWADREGVTLLAIFLDQGLSGGLEPSRRPALVAALAALTETGAGVLLGANRLRFAREVTYMRGIEAEADKAGARVRTADGRSDGTGSNGVITKGIDDLLGEWERIVISERTTAALAVKKARGERVGGVPYGSQLTSDGVSLEPCQAELDTMTLVRAWHGSGVRMRAIVDRLNSEGYPARGSRWHLTTVARLLRGG